MGPSDIAPRTDRELLLELRRDVRHMKEMLDRELTLQYSRTEDHETRIRVLENYRWWLMGAIVGSAGLSAILAAVITRAIH